MKGCKVTWNTAHSSWTAVFIAIIVFALASSANASTLDHDLKVGDTCESVRLLQQMLNKDPRTQVASSGSGSPGQETSYFGDLTRQSVIKFQELYQDEVLVPAGVSQPTGYFGPFSRTQLNTVAGDTVVSNHSTHEHEQTNAVLNEDRENDPYFKEEVSSSTGKGHVLKKEPTLSFRSKAEYISTSTTIGLWSDPLTWGGEVPLDGASVVIPSGKVVTLDMDIRPMSLKIDGELKFANKDITVTADWINVSGKLIIGTESEPYRNKAVITLTGVFDPSLSMMKAKALAVHGGVL